MIELWRLQHHMSVHQADLIVKKLSDNFLSPDVQLTWTARTAGAMVNLNYAEETLISYLPLSHVAAQVNDMWISMRFAGTTYFAEPDALKVKIPHAVRTYNYQ